MKSPCKDCFDRKLLCHGRCERYQKFKTELAERAEAKRKKDAATPELCRDVVRQIWRDMKK